MKRITFILSVFLLIAVFESAAETKQLKKPSIHQGFTDAASFGFLPNASGIDNTKALQKAVDQTGTIVVSQAGTYKMAGTVYIGSNTSLIFGNNIYLKKVDEKGTFTHVILNKGALTKTYDQNIVIDGLQIIVNGMDKRFTEVYGLRGQLAFFYVKDIKIERFRCMDLMSQQFCIHVCTFEDLIVDDVIIKGDKDGVHLGRGKRFTIRNGIFETYDDAIALNAHDYATSNPELGWIEDGVVENCHDLTDNKKHVGYFCRILAGAWIDWKPGMEVQHSDAVVYNNRIYRVQMQADGKKFTSNTAPTHETGAKEYDGINWGVVQTDVTYTAGVRNVVFRNIYLEKPRVGFSIHFDNDRYSRSYYPGAEIPKQEQILLDNIRVLYNEPTDFLSVGTPMDVITITNSSFKTGGINFHGNKAMPDYLKTKINIVNSVFNKKGEMQLLTNSVEGKQILLKTSSNLELHDDFSAKVSAGNGTVVIESDLTGLKK
jgi:hypothetical protein